MFTFPFHVLFTATFEKLSFVRYSSKLNTGLTEYGINEQANVLSSSDSIPFRKAKEQILLSAQIVFAEMSFLPSLAKYVNRTHFYKTHFINGIFFFRSGLVLSTTWSSSTMRLKWTNWPLLCHFYFPQSHSFSSATNSNGQLMIWSSPRNMELTWILSSRCSDGWSPPGAMFWI